MCRKSSSRSLLRQQPLIDRATPGVRSPQFGFRQNFRDVQSIFRRHVSRIHQMIVLDIP